MSHIDDFFSSHARNLDTVAALADPACSAASGLLEFAITNYGCDDSKDNRYSLKVAIRVAEKVKAKAVRLGCGGLWGHDKDCALDSARAMLLL